MSALCTDATIDSLIKCIDGWLTTHCVCTQAFTAPGTSATHPPSDTRPRARESLPLPPELLSKIFANAG
jgi:hypothetical protein